MEYVESAVFVFDEAGAEWEQQVSDNPFGVRMTSVRAEGFLETPERFAPEGSHIVLCAAMAVVEPVIRYAIEHGVSLGFLPQEGQKLMLRNFHLSKRFDENLEVALRNAAEAVDVTRCNDRIMLFKAALGRVPLLEPRDGDGGLVRLFRRVRLGINGFFAIRLRQTTLTTANGQKVETSLSGLTLQQSERGGPLPRLEGNGFSMRDGQLGAVLVSPFSVVEYLRLLGALFSPTPPKGILPPAIGLIRSASVRIESTRAHRLLTLDNTTTLELPVTCTVQPESLRINAPEAFWEANPKGEESKESVKVANLPDPKESLKYEGKHIPFFSSASEERFRELFSALRDDARIKGTYITLMLLSTMLATVGLFADSAAVTIGAMLLAPLMAPIVSLAMGMLRGDMTMLRRSLGKVAFGVVLALGASSLLALLLPNFELTGEMKARIHPTLLDLAVAVISGVAAAYSKSFKEIVQSLAGVAIAVALVPPLSTAGIGLGRGEWMVFSQAFLLFFTNLIGIALAATLTFHVLGYSGTVRSRKSLLALSMMMVIIIYPLSLSFQDIVKRHKVAQAMKYERFLIGDQYIIVKSASIRYGEKEDILDINLVARDALRRDELSVLKRKIESALGRELHINATVEYIL